MCSKLSKSKLSSVKLTLFFAKLAACSRTMFAAATRNFVEEVDVGGLLIPVSSPNDNISALSVVVKRKGLWLWQKHKYTPTDFKLNDILTGDPPINPGTHLLRDSGCIYKAEII